MDVLTLMNPWDRSTPCPDSDCEFRGFFARFAAALDRDSWHPRTSGSQWCRDHQGALLWKIAERKTPRRETGRTGLKEFGAGEEIRTPDPRITNALLYQLSYPGEGAEV